MTREQQRQLRNLKKELPHIVQAEIKQYKINKRDFMIWRRRGDVFYDASVSVGQKDNKCYCSVRGMYKPLWLDDLFWDIMGMEENKKEPLSLRCIGAFTVYGNQFMEDRREMKSWSVEEMSICVREYISRFALETEEDICSRFAEEIPGTPYHADLRQVLYLIYLEKYVDAGRRIAVMDQDLFVNKGIGFRAAAMEYCRQRMM